MLTKLDELNLTDHRHLDARDECYFIGEYTAGRGYSHSATNQLILNLKKALIGAAFRSGNTKAGRSLKH